MDTPVPNNQSKVHVTGKILIVEDDNFLRKLLGHKIQEKGYTVSLVNNGEDALKTAEEMRPDIILLDIILPGMNGFEILERLKAMESTKHCNVIILSNLNQQKDIDKAHDLGASQFLVKANTSPHEVIEKIDKILNFKQTLT